jgi:hypothetical protein
VSAPAISLISLEPSRRCSKGCAFCYNGSSARGEPGWTAAEVIALARDCASHGVRAISFGGGEPTEWDGLEETLAALDGALFRTLTTHGLGVDLDRLAALRPDKVHVSVHAPESRREVGRVIEQVTALAARGLKSGVNLLVRRSRLFEAARAMRALRRAGIGADRVVLLPMRGDVSETPSPAEIAAVAAGPFQSTSCLSECAPSDRFVSIAADHTVAWCSYTRSRRRLEETTHAALMRALDGLALDFCGGALVKLGARAS